MLVALLCSVLAAPPLPAEEAALTLAVTPGAEAEALPPAQPGVLEIAVTGNRVSLHRQIQQVRASGNLYLPGVRDFEALSLGGGRSFLRIRVSDATKRAVPTVEDGRLSVAFVDVDGGSESATMGPFEGPLPVSLLASAPPPRRPANPPSRPLVPLVGDASHARIDPLDIPLDRSSHPGGDALWVPPVPVVGPTAPLHRPPTSWSAIDGYRAVLTTGVPSETVETAARMRLAQAHLRLGMPHEADYYLRAVLHHHTNVALPADVHLLSAQARVGVGDWEGARTHCIAASELGAPPAWVLPCLGALAFETGVPAPTDVGRAIGALETTEGVPTNGVHLLLAAQLLASDHRYTEAARLAERSIDALMADISADLHGPSTREHLGRAWLTLGDARYLLSEDDAAAEAWTRAARLGFSRLVRLRRAMRELSTRPRRTWGRTIPWLDRQTRDGSPAAVEAHYLLAQIESAYSDPAGAARRYSQIWDLDPARTLRSDVPERQLAACEDRLLDLADAGRWADTLVFAKSCWRPELDWLAADTRVQETLADAWDAVGLVKPALQHQRRAVQVRNQLGRDDLPSLLDLADLYTRSGRAQEALETVEYVRSSLPAEVRRDPRISLVEAEAWAALGEPDRAVRLLASAERVSAATHPGVPERARTSIALLEARRGRCDRALPRLEDLALEEALAPSAVDAPAEGSRRGPPLDFDRVRRRETQIDLLLARSRCRLEAGDTTGAAEDAARANALEREALPATSGEGAWLEASIAAREEPEGDPPVDTSKDGIWASLLAEERLAAQPLDRLR
jgi:tetratricopeptide (TPR) repeat protein